MDIIKKLKSNEFAVIVAVLSVLVQSFHSFTAFYNVSSLQGTAWGIAQAVLFAIVFDLAILFYTVRNKRDVVLVAAVILVLINAYYYYQHLGFTFEFIFGCFLSVIIPVTQYYYSEEIREEESGSGDKVDLAIARIREITQERDELVELNRKYIGEMKDALKVVERAEAKAEKLARELDQVIAWRDSALNSNSVLSEALGRKEREIFELKKRVGDLPDNARIDPDKIVQEIRESIEDKSLLNVTDDAVRYGAYNPTRSNAPTPED